MTPNLPIVLQCDRDAAADYYLRHMGGTADFLVHVRRASTGSSNALAIAFARHRTQAIAEERERILGIVADRKAIYAKKMSDADPFADDDCNRHERMQHAVEAHDWLEAAIRQETSVD